MHESDFITGITFDDVLMLPGKSDVVPSEVDTSGRFSRNININIPIASAAMDRRSRRAMSVWTKGCRRIFSTLWPDRNGGISWTC